MAILSAQRTESPPLWRQIQKNNFSRVPPLLDYLELSEENRKKVLLHPRFSLNLPVRLAEKMEKNNLQDPLFRQFVPVVDELVQSPGFTSDPIQDIHFQKTKKILHKYQGRALLLTTSACAMHCRYCFRQNFPYETEEKSFEEELSYLAQDPSIAEIVLSGGDPLSLGEASLTHLFHSFEAIPHLKRIRLHTRFPIGIPERIDEALLHLFANSSKQIFFVIHVNHSQELDEEIFSALKKVQQLGIPVLSQSVLLKGVNDDPPVFLSLCEALINRGILPYYLHALDPVQGAQSFHLPDEEGKELIRFVQENLSGFGVPRLVRENPGLLSKTFL